MVKFPAQMHTTEISSIRHVALCDILLRLCALAVSALWHCKL